MADTELPLSMLSNIALKAGVDLGFNAAGVELWCDSESLERRLAVTFGDRDVMRKRRLQTPGEWALSWTEEVPCIRECRTIELPYSMRNGAAHRIESMLTESLLELMDG